MKVFQFNEIFEAYEHARLGGQALHLHTLNAGHPLFRRYPVIAHFGHHRQAAVQGAPN